MKKYNLGKHSLLVVKMDMDARESCAGGTHKKMWRIQIPYLSEYRVYLNTRRITCFWGMEKKPEVIRLI